MAGLVQYNGNNNRKSNHNVANNTEEKSFEYPVNFIAIFGCIQKL